MRKLAFLCIAYVLLCCLGCESTEPLYMRRIPQSQIVADSYEDAQKYYICASNLDEKKEYKYVGAKKLDDTERAVIQNSINELIYWFYNWNYAHMHRNYFEQNPLPILTEELALHIENSEYFQFTITQIKRYHMVYRVPELLLTPGNYIQIYRDSNEVELYGVYAALNLEVEADTAFYDDYDYLNKGSTMLVLWIYLVLDENGEYKIKQWYENYITSDQIRHSIEIGFTG